MSQINRPPHRTFGRLSLEALESRLNPADFWWSPVYSEFSTDPRNWVKGPTAPWDRYQVSEPAPGPSDHLYFLGGLSSNNCTIPQPSYTVDGQAFAGIHLLFGPISLNNGNPGTPGVPLPPPPPPVAYTGTVTTAGSFTVGTLEVDCGQIKQADPATVGDEEAPFAGTLTVKNTFDWTGGTLNSNTVAGTIALAPGATGIAAPSFTNPGINGTVALGSTLLLQGTEAVFPLPSLGSTLDVMKGTFQLLHGNGFVADEWTHINFMAEPGLTGKITIDAKPHDNPSPKVTVKKGAECKVFSTNRRAEDTTLATVTVEGNDSILASGAFYNLGHTTIQGYTELKISPVEGRTGGYLQAPAQASEGTTSLEAGSKITCDGQGWVWIQKGRFEITNLMGGDGQPASTQPAAVVSAPDNVLAALKLESDAVLTMPGTKYSTLFVDGIFLSEGEIRLAINRSTEDCDKVRATKAVNVDSATSKLTLRWDETSNIIPPDQQKWELLASFSNEMSDKPPTITRPDKKISVARTPLMNFLNANYTR